jgi:hypothetical protein
MPSMKTWTNRGVLEALENFTKDALSVALSKWALQQEPPFNITCCKKWEPFGGKWQFRAYCASCQAGCKLSLLAEEETPSRYVIRTAGDHSQDAPCQKKSRGWTAAESKAMGDIDPEDVDTVLRALDDAGVHGVGLVERVRQRARNKRKAEAPKRKKALTAELHRWCESVRFSAAQGPSFHRYSFFILDYCIDNDSVKDGKFLLAFACEGHQQILSNLIGPVVLSFDGTFRIVFGGYVQARVDEH